MNSDIDKRLNKSGLPINKINGLLKSLEEKMHCDTNCQREKDLERLRREWKESAKKLEKLPKIIDRNERKFFVAKNGEDYYSNVVLRTRYTNYINDWRDDQLKKFEEVQKLMEIMFENFKAQKISKSRINQLYDELLQKNKDMKREIDDFIKKSSTNERRVWYQIQDNEGLEDTQFYIKIFFYAVLITYIIFGGFIKNQEYKNWKIWLAILGYIFVPFLLHYIISIIIYYYTIFKNRAPGARN